MQHQRTHRSSARYKPYDVSDDVITLRCSDVMICCRVQSDEMSSDQQLKLLVPGMNQLVALLKV